MAMSAGRDGTCGRMIGARTPQPVRMGLLPLHPDTCIHIISLGRFRRSTPLRGSERFGVFPTRGCKRYKIQDTSRKQTPKQVRAQPASVLVPRRPHCCHRNIPTTIYHQGYYFIVTWLPPKILHTHLIHHVRTEHDYWASDREVQTSSRHTANMPLLGYYTISSLPCMRTSTVSR